MDVTETNQNSRTANPVNSDKILLTATETELMASLVPQERTKFLISKRIIDLTNKLSSAAFYYTTERKESLNNIDSLDSYKDFIQREIEELKEVVLKEWPDYTFPASNKLPNTYLKVSIPEEDFPDYNFVGMLIGPKGITQKEIETKTGAKLSIIGTSIHEESGGKHTSMHFRSDEPLYLKINGPSKKNIEAAYKLVKPLLTPK
eukprot:GAHX01001244.1.p1 GENE.GAHX01001244.1~~GAHX01001244.1.p1  ORF type:complete len:204 (-),score=51.57 GAHX01001244.1:30-641(-)